MGIKYKDPTTGQFKDISVKVADSLPIGTEVDYDGETVPTGWEEVDSPNEYSTEETKIGTWIDGKPLYRKVIVVTGLQASGAKSVVHNISNLGNVTNISGSVILNYDTGNFKRKAPLSQLPASWNTFINIGETAVIINRTTSGSELDIIIQIVLEYTKTTD